MIKVFFIFQTFQKKLKELSQIKKIENVAIKSDEKYPGVSKKLANITDDLDDLVKYLDKYKK